MAMVGQTVNNRHRSFRRPFIDDRMVVGSDHDPVQVTRQDTRRVRNRLPARELNVAHGKDQRMAAKLVHSRFE